MGAKGLFLTERGRDQLEGDGVPPTFAWGKLFDLQLELFCLQLSFFAYSPLRPLVDALSHSKTAPAVSEKGKAVSKEAPIVSEKAKIVNCKEKSSTASRKLPTVSKKAASKLLCWKGPIGFGKTAEW